MPIIIGAVAQSVGMAGGLATITISILLMLLLILVKTFLEYKESRTSVIR